MAVIPTEPAARHAYFVALGRAGGTATYATYGAAHMAALGRVGFAVTLGRYGGDVVWHLLRDSYLQKFPDRTGPQRRATDEAHEKDRLRAAVRRLYPDPQPCLVCSAPGQERHHVNGVLAGNGPENVAWHCVPCHAAKTAAQRQVRWGTKESPGRTVAH